MIVKTDPQGSDAWVQSRIGLPTASGFKSIITPTGKPAKADRYLARLFAEWFLGCSLDEAQSGFMERGSQMEQEAVAWYAFDRDADPQEVGLCLTDDGRAGASPDRTVDSDGLLEVKCPSAEIHAVYLTGGITDEYRTQIQGQLWVTARAWCDLLCYHPIMPRVVVRFERDEEYIDAMATLVDGFCDRLDALKAKYATEREAYHVSLREAAEDEQASIGAVHTGGSRNDAPVNYSEAEAALQ